MNLHPLPNMNAGIFIKSLGTVDILSSQWMLAMDACQAVKSRRTDPSDVSLFVINIQVLPSDPFGGFTSWCLEGSDERSYLQVSKNILV